MIEKARVLDREERVIDKLRRRVAGHYRELNRTREALTSNERRAAAAELDEMVRQLVRGGCRVGAGAAAGAEMKGCARHCGDGVQVMRGRARQSQTKFGFTIVLAAAFYFMTTRSAAYTGRPFGKFQRRWYIRRPWRRRIEFSPLAFFRQRLYPLPAPCGRHERTRFGPSSARCSTKRMACLARPISRASRRLRSISATSHRSAPSCSIRSKAYSTASWRRRLRSARKSDLPPALSHAEIHLGCGVRGHWVCQTVNGNHSAPHTDGGGE